MTIALWGQTPNFEGRRIAAVVYSPAEQPLDPADLARVQTLKPGEPLRSEAVAAAIDQLYATGRYDDIQVEAEPSGSDVTVRFVTTNRWFVGHVGASGKLNLPPNRGQVVNATQLTLGTPLEPDAVNNAQANLRRIFENNGLYEVKIDPQTDRDPEAQQVNFTFNIKPGKRAHYTTPIIQGDPKLSDSAVIRATGWKYRFILGWKKVTEARTRGGVLGLQNKYSKDDRLMAKIEMKSLDYDPKKRRVQPTLNIDAGPKVRIKAVEAKVSKRTMRKYIPIYQEQRVDQDLLVEGARNLRDYFQTQGYYDVDIDFRQRQQSKDEVAIEYVVSKGQRYKLEDVRIEGNKYFTTDVIRERMFLEPAGFVRFRHGRYSEAFRKKDAENIENLYRSNGFRDVKVTSTVDRDYRGKNGQMGVVMHIDEGPQWFVDGLTINGANRISKALLEGQLSSSAGQPFSELNVAADRSAILTTYYTGGFPDATFRWDSKPGAQPNHVSLIYTVTEGDQQFVRDVLVSGVRTTRMSLLDKRITVSSGDPLSLAGITNGQKNLYDTGVLAKVTAATQNPEGKTTHKYVLYDINEAARYNVNIGFGAEFARLGGTANALDTPGGNAGFSPRVSLDVSRLNMFGLGHYATLRGRVSTLQKRASIDYVAPRFLDVEGRNITLTLLYDDSREVRTFASKREEASIQVSQQFSKATTGLFRYTYRRVSTSSVVIPTLLVPQLLQPVRIGLLSANIVQDRRDDPADAHRGIFNSVDFGLASRYVASNRSFLRSLGRNATYYKLTKNVVLARETTVGVIFPFSVPAGLDRNDSIPLPERFFGGGSTSHRGFPENQAGPRDVGLPAGPGAPATQPTGFPLGGNALLFNIVELRFPLIGDNIRGVVFHDAGNIYRSVGDISFRASQRDSRDFDYMVHAVGFGVRYKTPIGPVRGDLSYSVNPPSYVGFKGTTQDLLRCDPSRPLDQLPSFCQGVPQRISHFQFFFSIGQTF